MKRNIILVTPVYPPNPQVGAARAFKLSRFLQNHFDKVYVVVEECGHETTNERASDSLQVIKVNSSDWGDKWIVSIFKRIYMRVVEEGLFLSGLLWSIRLRKDLKALVKSDKNITTIIVSGGPFIPFFVCRDIAKDDKNLIIDYRDLWSQNPQSRAFKYVTPLLLRFLETRLLKSLPKSTRYMTVSEGCKRCLSLLGVSEHNITVLLNEPLCENIQTIRYFASTRGPFHSRTFNILFAGTVYPQSSFRPLLESIRSMNPTFRERLCISYMGNEIDFVIRSFKKFSLESNLTCGPAKPFESYAKIYSQVDLCLNLVYDSHSGGGALSSSYESYRHAVNGIITTKVFDYISSGLPVLNIGPHESDLNAYVTEIGYRNFFNFESDEIERISSYLEESIIRWLCNSKPILTPLPFFPYFGRKLTREHFVY